MAPAPCPMMLALRDPWVWLLGALTVAAKVPLLWLNSAEYTDGLIQLRLFDNGCPLYMPLYTVLCLGLHHLGLEPLMAGRVVSLLALGVTGIALAAITAWLTGSRAAGLWALALYAVSPVPTRWGIRVMTDSLFAGLWWISLAGFLAAAGACIAPIRRPRLSQGAVVCLAFGALAALTRHTGWILAPLGALTLFAALREGGARSATLPVLSFLLFTAPLVWMLGAGAVEGHGAQVSARFTPLAALQIVESYAVDWPLFVGWPLALLTVWALARPVAAGPRWRLFAAVALWCVIGILAMQVLIQSYLERYLLPLFGFPAILGGAALARLGIERPRLLAPAATLTLGWLLVFNVTSLWKQRDSWGDFRRAAEAMAELASPGTPCFTNESYAMWPEGDTTKAAFWSGRSVQRLFLSTPEGTAIAPLPPGSLVLISSAYGGTQAYGQLAQELYRRHDLEVIGEWRSEITPLLPDLMDGPFHQNPLAVRLRHQPQEFRTSLLRILADREALP